LTIKMVETKEVRNHDERNEETNQKNHVHHV
jgi:hypothetical protein